MLKPLYALVSADPFLQAEAMHKLLAQLPADAQRIDIDGETATLADVLDEVRCFAMFGGIKVVVLNEAGEFISRFRQAMEDYCEHPTEGSVLILRLESLPKTHRIAKIIAKNGQVVDAVPPKPYEMPGWITQRARTEHKLAVTMGAAQILADLLGNNLGRVNSELSKLALQCPSGKVDVTDIQGSVAFQREQEIYAMTDELAAGKPADAMRRWRQLVQTDKTAEFRAVTWLYIWLEKSIKALEMSAAGSSNGEIGRVFKIYPDFKIDNLLKTARRMGQGGLRQALTLLLEVDLNSKSGLGDAVDNVERFILEVGNRLQVARAS